MTDNVRDPKNANSLLEDVVRDQWGRLVGLLLAQYRRLDLVEDALGDAVETAARNWGDDPPDNPSGWLMTTAKRKMLDRLRTESVAARKAPLLVTDAPPVRAGVGDVVEDERLRLVLMCAHPALAPDAASALSLRLVLGVSTADIARLFLVTEPTMAARLTRAKKKIVGAGVPFAVPAPDLLPDRLDTVAQTAYLAFTAGYAPGSGPDLLRSTLAGEAIRLVRVVDEAAPGQPVLRALLALMLLQHSRRDARVDASGALVLLADQDRGRWHHDEIAEAVTILTSVGGEMSEQAFAYLLQARIAVEHALAPSSSETAWARIVDHYDTLLNVLPSPAARLARAVALAEAEGPAEGLAALDGLDIPGSHRVPAARAELCARLGDAARARVHYDEAIALAGNDVERSHLEQRRALVSGG